MQTKIVLEILFHKFQKINSSNMTNMRWIDFPNNFHKGVLKPYLTLTTEIMDNLVNIYNPK